LATAKIAAKDKHAEPVIYAVASITTAALLGFVSTYGAFILVTMPCIAFMVFRTHMNIIMMTYSSSSNTKTVIQTKQ